MNCFFALLLTLASMLQTGQEPASTKQEVTSKPKRFDHSTFKAIHFAPGSTSVGDFTLAGPKTVSLVPLPNPSMSPRIAFDSVRKQYFLLTSHGVDRLDQNLRNREGITPKFKDKELEFSWPCGITTDKKRDRLLVCTLGGVGYLYAYSLSEKTWSVVSNLNNIDMLGLAAQLDIQNPPSQ